MGVLRFKIKHLLIGLAGLLLMGTTTYFAVPSLLFIRADALARGGQMDQAQQLYRRVADYFPYSPKAAQSLFRIAVAPAGDDDKLYIFPGETGSGGSRPEVSPEDKIKVWQRLKQDYPKSRWSQHADFNLGEIYYSRGDLDMAEKYLTRVLDEGEEWRKEETVSLLAKMYMRQGRYAETLKLAERYLQGKPSYYDAELLLLQGDAFLNLGLLDEARNAYQAVAPRVEQWLAGLKEEHQLAGEPANKRFVREAERRLAQLNPMQTDINEVTGNLSGKVVLAGTPTAGIEVYLRPQGVRGLSIPPGDDYQRALTDGQGRYSFTNLVPGSYQVGIGVRPEQVEGLFWPVDYREKIEIKSGQQENYDVEFRSSMQVISPMGEELIEGDRISFSWKPLPGASFYRIAIGPLELDDQGNITGTYSSFLPEKIQGTTHTVSIEQLNAEHPGISWGQKGITPASILGPAYPGSLLSWSVTAYDQEEKVLSSSVGYYFYTAKGRITRLKISPEGLREADGLLAERKYEEAIQEYQKDLAGNPNDLHALEVLGKLNLYGIQHDQSDPEAALPYLEKLAALRGSVEDWELLARAQSEAGRFEEAIGSYQKLLQEESDQWLNRNYLARNYLRVGRFTEALQELEKAAQANNGFPPTNLIVLKLLRGEREEALALAEKDPAEGYHNPDFAPALKFYLQAAPENNEEFHQLIKQDQIKAAEELLKQAAGPRELFLQGLMELTRKQAGGTGDGLDAYRRVYQKAVEMYGKTRPELPQVLRELGRCYASNFGE